MHNYKAIVFDLDGTLLDTLEDLATSMNSVLKKHNYPTHEIPAYRYFVGDGVEKLVQRVLPKDQQEKEIIEACVREMRETYGKRWADTTQLYDGIADLLTALNRKKVRLAVFSNKPDDFTQKMVDHYLSDWDFEMVMGAKPNLPKKPDPQGAINIAKTMKLPASRFLYIGDTNTDMQTATKAGMYPVGAAWGFRPAEELLNNGAQVIITAPLELIDRFFVAN